MFTRNRCVSLALSALLLALAGCAVPLTQKCKGWFSGGSSSRCIDDKSVSFIAPGKTTKDDVIGGLGFPSRVFRNGGGGGSVYAYDRKMLSWVVILAGGYSSNGFAISRDHLLLVEFDAENRVVRFARKEGYAALGPEFPTESILKTD